MSERESERVSEDAAATTVTLGVVDWLAGVVGEVASD